MMKRALVGAVLVLYAETASGQWGVPPPPLTMPPPVFQPFPAPYTPPPAYPGPYPGQLTFPAPPPAIDYAAPRYYPRPREQWCTRVPGSNPPALLCQ